MLRGKDYLREIQKFTTSQYWNAGLRVTAGVMLPTFVLAHYGWLTIGMPFLWGALFVSITDMPGPIHHRRNGLFAAVAINTVTVLITVLVRDNQILLISVIILFSFFYSLLGVFGNRSGAIGVLALVIMLLNIMPHHDNEKALRDTLLIFAGGVWYTGFSLLLYRLRPYRLAEQAVGENLIALAEYLQARASLYKEGADIKATFHRVMEEQATVLKCQDQAREILFKTRQFVGDASPKSRSIMMIFIESIDLLEQAMTSYQNYELLHKSVGKTGLLNKFYGVILQVAAELEHIGLLVQSGAVIRKDITFTSALGELADAIEKHKVNIKPSEINGLQALEKGLNNLKHIAGLMQRLVQYTRFEIDVQKSYTSQVEINKVAISQPIRWQEIRENLTLKSNTFRHALRLTAAMMVGYALSIYFSLSHAYWVLLTIVTILKPVYAVSRVRNIQRVSGTLVGALVAMGILYFVSNTGVLLTILIFSMIMGYSFLRINYFGFVLFLTVYIIITFHFLNPGEFNTLIKERLIDTVVGSVIAAITARYILPVWVHDEIETNMREMLANTHRYFEIAWHALSSNASGTQAYKLARKDAVVSLTNLSENFQRILSEPKQASQSVQLHQFVITSHLLMGHIAALNTDKIQKDQLVTDDTPLFLEAIKVEFNRAENKLNHKPDEYISNERVIPSNHVAPQLLTIYNLVHDLRLIIGRMQVF